MSAFATPSTSVYQCTALVGTNKKGHLPCDSDGYYTLMVGGLNTYNSAGAYYPLEPARMLFQDSSGLMRRVATGNCKGECGHPKPLPGQSTRSFIERVLQIEETRVCCHFRKLWLEERKEGTQGFTAIMAELKPSGPMGPALKEALDNPHENVCFSIRSLTNDRVHPRGYLEKSIKTIVGFDWVTEPGIRFANKYSAPSLEGLTERFFGVEDLPVASHQEGAVASMEQAMSETVKEAFGWLTEHTQAHRPPVSFYW